MSVYSSKFAVHKWRARRVRHDIPGIECKHRMFDKRICRNLGYDIPHLYIPITSCISHVTRRSVPFRFHSLAPPLVLILYPLLKIDFSKIESRPTSAQLLQYLRFQQAANGGTRSPTEGGDLAGNGEVRRFQYCFYLVRVKTVTSLGRLSLSLLSGLSMVNVSVSLSLSLFVFWVRH